MAALPRVVCYAVDVLLKLVSNLATLLTTVIEQPSFTTAAQQFAAKHREHDPSQISTKILDQLFDALESELALRNKASLHYEEGVT